MPLLETSLLMGLVGAGCFFLYNNNKKKQNDKTLKRKMSFTSLIQADQELWKEVMGREQQVVAVQLFFAEENNNDNKDTTCPTRQDMLAVATTLANHYERLRGIPDFTTKTFKDVADLETALEKIVIYRDLADDSVDGARKELETLKAIPMVAKDEEGLELPLWRVYVLGKRSIVVCIDHALGDGLSFAALLSLCATSDTDGQPLTLEQTSPVFKPILQLGDSGVRWYYRSLWWPPAFFRAFAALVKSMPSEREIPSPFFPKYLVDALSAKDPDKAIAQCKPGIPPEYFGTVYFCPVPLALMKKLGLTITSLDSSSTRSGATINDMIVACVTYAVKLYLEESGTDTSSVEFMRFGFPVAVPKPPSYYLDPAEGMSLSFVPSFMKLPIQKQKFKDHLLFAHEQLVRLKKSGSPLLMKGIMGMMGTFLEPASMKDEFSKGLGKASFVLSNVPGPSIPIRIADRRVSEMQVLVSNPFTMMQATSYAGDITLSVQLDTRTATDAVALADAFHRTIGIAAEELLNDDKDPMVLSYLKRAKSFKSGPFLAAAKN